MIRGLGHTSRLPGNREYTHAHYQRNGILKYKHIFINKFTLQLPYCIHLCDYLMNALLKGSSTAGFALHCIPNT